MNGSVESEANLEMWSVRQSFPDVKWRPQSADKRVAAGLGKATALL